MIKGHWSSIVVVVVVGLPTTFLGKTNEERHRRYSFCIVDSKRSVSRAAATEEKSSQKVIASWEKRCAIVAIGLGIEHWPAEVP